MENFWKKLKKPFFCLAPMSDVTDIAFRRILAKYGKNRENKDRIVFWTEFVAADGLCNKLAKKKLSHILKYSEGERPIVAQVFGANPENMKNNILYANGPIDQAVINEVLSILKPIHNHNFTRGRLENQDPLIS